MHNQRLTHSAALRSRSGLSSNSPTPRLQRLHKNPRKHVAHALFDGQHEWSWSMCQNLSPDSAHAHIPHTILSTSSGIGSPNFCIRSVSKRSCRSGYDSSSRRCRARCLRCSKRSSRCSASSFGRHGPHTPLLYPRLGV